MRVCPNCGHVDNPLWRPSAFKWGADHTRIDDFIIMNPKLGKELKEKQFNKSSEDRWVEDKYFLYRISKFGNVTRIAKLEWTKKMFVAHGVTDSVSKHTKSIVKKNHYETLKKQKKLLRELKEK